MFSQINYLIMKHEVIIVDIKRKRELLDEWKNRHPEMGVIAFKCVATGEEFMGISKDTKADFNSNRFKLSAGGHPNKRMQELWDQYGENGFESSVLQLLKYESPQDDHTVELEDLLKQCMAKAPQARRIWR